MKAFALAWTSLSFHIDEQQLQQEVLQQKQQQIQQQHIYNSTHIVRLSWL